MFTKFKLLVIISFLLINWSGIKNALLKNENNKTIKLIKGGDG